MTDYIVHKPSRSILLNPSLAPLVLPVIDKARLARLGEKTVLQVYHGEEQVKVLSELLQTPIDAPILHYYDWPKVGGKYTPMEHQKLGAAFHAMNPRSFNLSEPRTGKTHTTLMCADYLIQEGLVKKVAIFSTLSTMDQVWVKAIFNDFHQHTYVSVHASSAAQRREILDSDVTFFVINHDGCKLLEKELIAKKFDMIIWDEADCVTNAQTDMWKAFNRLAKDAKYVIAMGATIVGERRPTDAWAITKIVNPSNVPKWFSEYRRMTMRQVTQFKWEPLPTANQTVFKTLQPAFCVRKKDVMDLPDMNVVRKECGLSEQQQKMFKEMKNTLATEVDDGKLLALNGADVLIKCLQILLGVYKADEDDYQPLECQPRIDAVLECIAATEKKVLVFCGFKGALRHYAKEIGKIHKSIYVDGSVQKTARDTRFKEFAAKGGPRVMFAHPKCVAHGLEFGENCDTIVWLGPISSGKQFTQANERIASLLQTSDMKMWYVGANKFEWTRYDQLEAKRDMQSDILDLCKLVLDT